MQHRHQSQWKERWATRVLQKAKRVQNTYLQRMREYVARTLEEDHGRNDAYAEADTSVLHVLDA